jgi:hypothetical protein
MPYLTPERKASLRSTRATAPGDLAYKVTKLMIDFTGDTEANPASFADHASTIGTVFCAVLEYYRRAAVPYEEVKRQQNGDVYPATTWPGLYAKEDEIDVG